MNEMYAFSLCIDCVFPQSFQDEALLAIIEMMQFKNFILFKLGRRRRESMSQYAREEFTEHFLVLPKECPMSSIVCEDLEHPNFNKMATEIYKKYVQKGAALEISVSLKARQFLEELIQNNRWKRNREYRNPKNL